MNYEDCTKCLEKFDQNNHIPIVLPCSDLMCLSCVNSHEKFLGYFNLKCQTCSCMHNLSSLNDLPKSQLITKVILESEENEKDDEDILPKSKRIKLDVQLNNLDYFIRLEKFELNKHYDSVISDIDIRTESLIRDIHKYRDILQEKVNLERKRSLDQLEEEEEEDDDSSEEVDSICKNKIIELKRKIKKLATPKQKNDNTKINYTKKTFAKITQHFNSLQSCVFKLKNKSYYFVDCPIKLDKSLIGHNLTNEFDRNYFKIKNIRLLTNDVNYFKRVDFKNEFEQHSLRHKIIPLSKDKIVKIFFTSRRTLCLQLYNSSGELLKEITPVYNLSSFPVSYGYNDHFCVCFASKNTADTGNMGHFFETSSNNIHLYDSDLNLVKSIKKFSSVESVFMNEKYVVVVHSHRSDACCSIYDYRLNELELFGQQRDKEADFFMERLNISWKEQSTLNYKSNPKVFGLTEKLIYFYNHTEMTIMDKINGKVIHKTKILGDKPYFMLDNQQNIIQVNKLSKKLAIFNFDHEFSIENNYDDCFDAVFVTCDNHLALINSMKKYLIMI